MRLYREWFFLVLAWIGSWFSFMIWPNVQILDFALKEDLFAAILFRPFHYLSSFLLLIFVILLLSEIIRKIIYETKIARLLRVIPYELMILSLLTLLLYSRVISFYPIMGTGISLLFGIYYVITYVQERKKEMFYVKD